MATSAFKSTSRRSSLAPGDAGSSSRAGAPRRSRSLSRCSGRFPPPPPEPEEDFTTPRGKFVNKTRGSGFPEISLDDLADEFFGTKGFEAEEDEVRDGTGRSGWSSGERFRMETESSRRKGRSVSKRGSAGNGDGPRQQPRSVSVARRRGDDLEEENNLCNGGFTHNKVAGEKMDLYGKDHSSRRRRSLSVARYRYGDLESDTDKSFDSNKLSLDNGNFQQSSSKKQANPSNVLRRTMSQKDLSQSLDNYSSHSSSLTDDEARDAHSSKSGPERIQTTYTREKAGEPIENSNGSGLYEAMRNEVRDAVREIRTELEKVMAKTESTLLADSDTSQPNGSNAFDVLADIRRNYSTKLTQSEKRKQDLLAELAAEEQHGQELTQIVRELLPSAKQVAAVERPSRSRRRSNDRTSMSKRLIAEAERYFEDFLSNVEDTDISSFDGERSDTSSSLGVSAKLREPSGRSASLEVDAIIAKAISSSPDNDGVRLPWLEWEISNDVSHSRCKRTAGVPSTSEQEANATCDNTTQLSSLASWSPEGNDSSPAVSSGSTTNKIGIESYLPRSSCSSAAGGAKRSSFDIEECLELRRRDDLLFEMFKQRQRIESGSLVLCGRATFI